MRKDVTIGGVALGASESGEAEKWDSCGEVIVPTLVATVLSECWMSSMAVEASQVGCMPSEVLIKYEGELVTGGKSMVLLLVVCSRSETPSEVAETGEERPLVCDMKDGSEVKLLTCEGSREDGDLTSCSEEGLVWGTPSDSASLLMVMCVCVESLVPTV